MREWWEPVNPYYDVEFEKKKKEEDDRYGVVLTILIFALMAVVVYIQ